MEKYNNIKLIYFEKEFNKIRKNIDEKIDCQISFIEELKDTMNNNLNIGDVQLNFKRLFSTDIEKYQQLCEKENILSLTTFMECAKIFQKFKLMLDKKINEFIDEFNSIIFERKDIRTKNGVNNSDLISESSSIHLTGDFEFKNVINKPFSDKNSERSSFIKYNKKVKKISKHSKKILKSWYEKNNIKTFPCKEIIISLSEVTSLSQKQVTTWLVNYRIRTWSINKIKNYK